MPDQARGKDVGAIWGGQPEEELAVDLEPIVNRRTEELSSSTGSEIVMSMGAALLFVGVMVWRFAPTYERLQEVGFAAVIAWVVISLYGFRRRIWGGALRARTRPRRPAWNITAKSWNVAALT
jgi:hypothetical protein